METRFDTTILTYGLEPSDFKFERYRVNEVEDLSSNGVGCRVTHKPSGYVVKSDYPGNMYPVNASRALEQLIGLVLALPSGVEDLLQKYEADENDFEDIKWVTGAALRLVETMPDSQARCLLYVLARHAQNDPYKKAAVLKQPVDNVRVVGDLLKHHKDDFVKMAQEEFQIEVILLNSTVRRSKLKSGTVDKLYGKISLKGHPADAYHKFKPIKNRITELLAQFGNLEHRPVIYTTSAGQTVRGYDATFRVVCGGEEDYEQWAKHGWL